MNYLLLKDISIYHLRLKYFHLAKPVASSIFYCQNTYYLVVKLAQNVITHYNILEQQIYKWGIAQIENKVPYIQIESSTKLVSNGRELDFNNYKIIRTFYGLSEIMQIFNITSDSFSDGGKYLDIDIVLQCIEESYSKGINLIDIGFESTRPDAIVKTYQEEIRLIKKYLPDIIRLKTHYPNLRLSIDTYHQESINYLSEYDIDYINDVSGNLDIQSLRKLQANGIKYIAMHSLDIPAVRERIINITTNPTEYISHWQFNIIKKYMDNDIDMNQIIFDPGIGFGKNPAQAFSIIRNLDKLRSPLLLGFSRKSLFGYLSNSSPLERDIYTAYLVCQLDGVVEYLRVHDINYLSKMLQLKNNI